MAPPAGSGAAALPWRSRTSRSPESPRTTGRRPRRSARARSAHEFSFFISLRGPSPLGLPYTRFLALHRFSRFASLARDVQHDSRSMSERPDLLYDTKLFGSMRCALAWNDAEDCRCEAATITFRPSRRHQSRASPFRWPAPTITGRNCEVEPEASVHELMRGRVIEVASPVRSIIPRPVRPTVVGMLMACAGEPSPSC